MEEAIESSMSNLGELTRTETSLKKPLDLIFPQKSQII